MIDPTRVRRFHKSLLATLLFAGVTAVLMRHHAPWRDEMQAWLIGRDCSTLSAVWTQAHYEGTPPLWHSLLWVVAKITRRPGAMQCLHWLIACAVCFLFCFEAPWPLWESLPLVFGYYLFYQYTVISRNYALGILFLTLACRAAKKKPAGAEALCWLTAASLTSVHALIVSLGIAVTLVLDSGPRAKRAGSGWFLYGAGLLTAIISIIPMRDTLFPSSAGWIFTVSIPRLIQTGGAAAQAFFPLPVPGTWESFVLLRSPTLGCFLGLAGLAWAGAALSTRTGRMSFFVSAGILLGFFYLKYIGYSRHAGFLFFAFVFALWLESPADLWQRRWRRPVWLIILLGQCVAGVIAATTDFRHTFSGSRDAAAWLWTHQPQNACVAAGADYLGAPLSAYLDRPLYFPQGDRWGSFTRWDRRRIEVLSDAQFVVRAEAATFREKCPAVVLALDHPLAPEVLGRGDFVFAASFTGSLVGDEDYFLYQKIRELK